MSEIKRMRTGLSWINGSGGDKEEETKTEDLAGEGELGRPLPSICLL